MSTGRIYNRTGEGEYHDVDYSWTGGKPRENGAHGLCWEQKYLMNMRFNGDLGYSTWLKPSNEWTQANKNGQCRSAARDCAKGCNYCCRLTDKGLRAAKFNNMSPRPM